MMDVIAGVGAALVVVMTALMIRHDTERLNALRTSKGPKSAKRLDDLLGRSVGKLPIVDKYATTDQRVRSLGQALFACGILVVISRPLAFGIAFVLLVKPVLSERKARKSRQRRIRQELPIATELFRLSVASGLNITQATAHVAKYTSGPIAEEFVIALQKVEQGRRIADAVEEAGNCMGEDAAPLVNALVSSERYGSPLSESLQRLADEARRDQERRAEQVGQRLALEMIVPVTVTGFPSFVALVLPPLIASSIHSLAW